MQNLSILNGSWGRYNVSQPDAPHLRQYVCSNGIAKAFPGPYPVAQMDSAAVHGFETWREHVGQVNDSDISYAIGFVWADDAGKKMTHFVGFPDSPNWAEAPSPRKWIRREGVLVPETMLPAGAAEFLELEMKYRAGTKMRDLFLARGPSLQGAKLMVDRPRLPSIA